MRKNAKKRNGNIIKSLLLPVICLAMCAANAYSQKTITGKVTDAKAEALVGVSVSLKDDGGSKGAITDMAGNYRIAVNSDNSTLEFSYLGFKTKSEIVGNRSEINVSMEEDLTELSEVVVVGYGTLKRTSMTGAVSQIGSKELLKAPMQDVSNLLTGKIPGLTSIQRSGKPGDDGTNLLVRGLHTFRDSNAPMIVVDGVPRPMNYVNPNDIESVSVLKDAAAAIYGVQGGNGVILITTKSGGEGPAKISYDGSLTMTQNTAMPEFLNARDYMYWHNKAREMDGLTPLWSADIQNRVMDNDPNSIWGQTDWVDKIFRNGWTQQHNISASGGTEKTKYFTSIGIMDQEGTMKNTAFTRYNVRTNLDIQVARNLRFITNLSGYHTDRDWPGTAIANQGEFNPARQAINSIPVIKDFYKGLPTAWNGGTYNVNGYAALYDSGFKRQKRWALDSNYKLEYDFSGLTNILKGLKVSLFGAYNYSNTTDSDYDRYYELYTVNSNFDEIVAGASGFTPGGGYAKSASWGWNWMLRPAIDYAREFGKNRVNLTLLYEAQKNYSNTMTGTKRGFYSDDPVDLTLGTTFTDTPVSGSYAYSGQASYAGRFNYAYDSKYLAEFTFRYDGTYIFPAENRWGFFPSVSLGWVLSQENFFSATLPSVDYFKIRASYGESGNNDVAPFLYQSTYAVANNSYVLGGQAIAQFYTNNPYLYRNLTWSTLTSYNLGIEMDMWRKKLGLELDLFYQKTTDILEGQSGNYPPSLGGYYPSYENSGELDNKGFEITLKHENKINQDWSYGLKGSFSFARNRVLKRKLTDSYPNYRAQLGQPIGTRYGFQTLGFFQTSEEIDNYPAAPSGNIHLGDLKYLDVNGDGIISQAYDYVRTGYGGIPEINFAMDMNISYKNFYVNLLWQGVSHTDYELSGVYDTGVTASTVFTNAFSGNGNSPYYLIEGAWTPENTNAKYPRLSTYANGNNAWRSTWWVVNGEYLRLKNANIGYNVPEKVLRKTPFSRVNIYVAGTNLLTFSHFKYVDPESPSVSNGYYPQQKTYSAGINVTF
jgi:TonB-linked SusC/RagA family outer membrane protein